MEFTNPSVNKLGGFAGSINGKVSNCFTTINTATKNGLGGFVGTIESIGKMSNCYTLSNNGNGVAGVNSGTMTNCYFNKDRIGVPTNKPEGKTTAEMKSQPTYTGWDFETVWEMSEGSYPVLKGLPAPEFGDIGGGEEGTTKDISTISGLQAVKNNLGGETTA